MSSPARVYVLPDHSESTWPNRTIHINMVLLTRLSGGICHDTHTPTHKSLIVCVPSRNGYPLGNAPVIFWVVFYLMGSRRLPWWDHATGLGMIQLELRFSDNGFSEAARSQVHGDSSRKFSSVALFFVFKSYHNLLLKPFTSSLIFRFISI